MQTQSVLPKPQPLLSARGWREEPPRAQGGAGGACWSHLGPEADAGVRVEDHLDVFRVTPEPGQNHRRGEASHGHQLVPPGLPGARHGRPEAGPPPRGDG